MGHFLEKGDALYWEKEVKRLMRLFDKIQRYLLYHDGTQVVGYHSDKQCEAIRKQIRHFRNIFNEE